MRLGIMCEKEVSLRMHPGWNELNPSDLEKIIAYIIDHNQEEAMDSIYKESEYSG